jgi:hypothetical protein
MFRRFHIHLRRGYFFGYVTGEGADEMIPAVTGETPKVIGEAILDGYELHIQKLREVTTAGENPQEILRKVWGGSFRSYVLVKKPGSQVKGVLLRLSIRARHKMDEWELVQMGWYQKQFVEVELVRNGKRYRAETQVLNPSQHATQVAPVRHPFWLMSKRKFIRLARLARNRRE